MTRMGATGLALLAALLLAGAGPQAAEVTGPKLTWDVSLWGKERAFTAGVERLAHLVTEKTDGNWNIVLHYGEALSKARENLDGLAVDAFQAAMFCNFYHPKKNRALMALTMPFLPLRSWEDNRNVRDAVYAHPVIRKELARWNAMTYVSSYLPQYEFLGRGRAPLTLDDWKGLTVRAGGGLGRAMKVLGSTPTSSTATEVYTGVQQGTMDAVSFPFTYGHVDYKIHEVTEWFTSNLSPGTTDCPIAFSISAYESLPEQYKILLEDVKDEVTEAQIEAYILMDEENLPMLRRELEEVRYSEAELAEFRAAAGRPVIEAWIEENQDRFDARGVIEAIFNAAGQSY